MKGHRSSMRTIPAINAAVPFSFWRRAKKIRVFWNPMMIVRPMMNRILEAAVSRDACVGVVRVVEHTFPMANL